MTKLRALILSFVLVALCIPVYGGAACMNCKFSPSHWGFCRPVDNGYSWCDEFVADPTTGQTQCDHPAVSDCTAGSGDSGGDCYWTDQHGGCILEY